MHDPLTDPAFRAVIEEYEARAAREEKLWETLTPEDAGRRRDEMLLPVGHAAGVLLNLLIQEGDARRILEVGSSYGYSTQWLAAGAREVQGQGHLARTAGAEGRVRSRTAGARRSCGLR